MIFCDRKKEQSELNAICASEPHLIHFLYGPINSGKTTLLNRTIDEFSGDVAPFYVNLRGRNIQDPGDFFNVLFDVDRKSGMASVREYMKEILKGGVDIARKFTGVPIPSAIFDLIFKAKDKGWDAFRYLEDLFGFLVADKNVQPVFILDELQVIGDVANSSGNRLLYKLFNLFVRLTKETHLCHCITATSDCLFIEETYANARLEGRARFILVDDLEKDAAIKAYRQLGLNRPGLLWEHIGGKLGDMLRVQVEKTVGKKEEEAVQRLLWHEIARLEEMLERLSFKKIEIEWEGRPVHITSKRILEALEVFKNAPSAPGNSMEPVHRLFLIRENILFRDPVQGILKPQGRLIHKAIETILDK